MNIDRLELSPRRKRQATLLSHFASLDYLKGLLYRVEDLILFAGALPDGQTHPDGYVTGREMEALGTSKPWSDNSFPILTAFRERLYMTSKPAPMTPTALPALVSAPG